MSLPSINFLHLTVSEIQPGQTISRRTPTHWPRRPPAHPDTMGENNTPTALKGCGVKNHTHTKSLTLLSQFDPQGRAWGKYYKLSRLPACEFLSPPNTFKSCENNNIGDKSQNTKSPFYDPSFTPKARGWVYKLPV